MRMPSLYAPPPTHPLSIRVSQSVPIILAHLRTREYLMTCACFDVLVLLTEDSFAVEELGKSPDTAHVLLSFIHDDEKEWLYAWQRFLMLTPPSF